MADYKLGGDINLAKLSRVGSCKIHGIDCLVIPIQENDIYIKTEEVDGHKKLKVAGIGLQVYENGTGKDNQNKVQQFGDRQYFVGQYGDTHYIKRSYSKEFVQSHSKEDMDVLNKVTLGNMKPFPLPSSNEAQTLNPAPLKDDEVSNDEELPF